MKTIVKKGSVTPRPLLLVVAYETFRKFNYLSIAELFDYSEEQFVKRFEIRGIHNLS